MKRFGRTAILGTLLCVSYISSAQNSGYMGKKLMLSAGVEMNTNKYFLERVYLPDPAGIKDYLDLKNTFSLEYTISRNMMVGVFANFNRINIYPATEVYPPFSTEGTKKDEIFQMRVNLIGAGFKYFSRNSIAPFGSYGEVQLGVIQASLVDSKGITEKKGSTLEELNSVYIGYGFGRQQLIFRNVFINIGANLKFSPLMIGKDGKSRKLFFDAPNGSNGIVTYDPDATILASYVLNAKIGLGLMLF